MGAITLDTTARNNQADAYDATINTGAGTATIEIRTAAGGGGTLLATFSLPNPAFGTAGTPTGGITLNGTPISATIAATGTASHCRIKDRDGNVRGDGTVTATGGGGLIEFATVAFVAGATARLTAGTITQPAS